MVDMILDLTLGHLKDSDDVTHAQLVSVEPDPLLGDQNNLEDKAYMQMVNMKPGLTWEYPEDSVMDAHAQFVSVELDPPLGDPHEDAYTHPEHTEPEVLTNIKNDLLHEVKEVKEKETDEKTTDVDKRKDPCINLQGLGPCCKELR